MTPQDELKAQEILKQYNYVPPAGSGQPLSWDQQVQKKIQDTQSITDPAAQTADGPPSTFSSVGGDIGDTFNKHADNVGTILNSNDAPASKVLQVGGEGAAAVSDSVGDVVKSVVKPEILASIGTHLAPLVESAAQSPAGQAVLNWWGGLNPETQRNLSAGGAIASLLSNAIGAGAAKEGVVAGTDAALSAAKDAVAPATKVAEDAANTVKQAVKGTTATSPAKNIEAITKQLTEDEDTATAGMKKGAINEGRKTVTKGKLGQTSVDYTPTAQAERAAPILHEAGVNAAKDTPDVVLQKINNTISKRGAEAEDYLGKNPEKITAKEQKDLLDTLKTDAQAKDERPSVHAAYDAMMKNFTSRVVGKGGFTTDNYYKALKSWEADIGESLPSGKEALLDTTGVSSARVRAAGDIRKAVRDLIGQKNPEFQTRMQDLSSLYEAKAMAKHNLYKVKPQKLGDVYPRTKKVIQGAALIGAGAVGVPLAEKII